MASKLLGPVSIAASGAQSYVFQPVKTTAQSFSFEVSARYAAVAGTSGLTVSFQVSADGTNYTAAKEPSFVLAPAAAATASGTAKIALEGPLKTDVKGSIAYVKVTLTNADATNAATAALLSEENYLI